MNFRVGPGLGAHRIRVVALVVWGNFIPNSKLECGISSTSLAGQSHGQANTPADASGPNWVGAGAQRTK
jgi:hypothetical protein